MALHFTQPANYQDQWWREQLLGATWGAAVLLPRSVTIDDFKIDLLGREVIFHGTCSSSKDTSGRTFKSSLCFAPNSLLGILESKILVRQSEKVSRRVLRNENGEFTIGDIALFMLQNMISLQGGELDSSADEADMKENE